MCHNFVEATVLIGPVGGPFVYFSVGVKADFKIGKDPRFLRVVPSMKVLKGTFQQIKDDKVLQPYKFILKFNTTEAQDVKALQYLQDNWTNTYYGFFFHNCADAAIGAMNAAGVKIPGIVKVLSAPNAKHHFELLFGSPDEIWQRDPTKKGELHKVPNDTWQKIKTVTIQKAISNTVTAQKALQDFFRTKTTGVVPQDSKIPLPVPWPLKE